MHSPDPFTPGFGDFQGIPNRTLPDDCMEYAIFVTDSASARTRLETVKGLAEELAGKWTEGYIWQREGFSLELVERKSEGTWCLQGRTEYGDSVDDEWFIVWMLRELSGKFSDLWIRVYDTDGEFLLIEAANALPKWLNPEIADYRVWINSSNLLIIPLSAANPTAATTPSRTAPISRPLTLSEALTTITKYTSSSTPSKLLSRIRLVEEEAFYRISRYPSTILQNIHHTILTLPRTVAYILHTQPSSIAAAVEAFYLRDPISLKALNIMEKFKPGDDVTISVKFTKVLYAQLKGQEFTPPPSSGFKLPPEGSERFNAADIGMKLTCGFEMLLSDAAAPQLSSTSRKKTVKSIQNLLTTLGTETVPLPNDEEIATWSKDIDSEEWLDIDYAEFEHTLQGKPGHKGTQNESGWGDKGAEENLKRMVERFEAFLNDDSAGLDGAEVGDDMDVDNDSDLDDDSDDDDNEGEDDEEGEDREVSFDEVEFEKMMREMMGMPSSLDGENEEAEIRKVMDRVEAELREAGALENTEPQKQRIKEVGDSDEDEDEDREVDIDYTLAANMLESFKGQGGLAGPGGNLLARMGIGLPRDEGDREGELESKEVGGRE